jgi:alcohol dehydrogenase class IV
MLPTLAVIDPELTYTLPPALTAATGIDALTQLIEAYTTHLHNPLTDGICVEGIKRAAQALPRACEDGSDAAAREDMSLAALFGGLALANAGLGAVHGFAGVIGGAFPAPHGALCGSLLPATTAINVRTLQAIEPDGETLQRYQHVARLVTGSEAATIQDGIIWLQDLCSTLHIPPLANYGITTQDFTGIIERTKKSSSYRKNPIELSDVALEEILNSAL